jgi:hypothetical protein
MGWLKLALVAAWLGAHALLWTLLPSAPGRELLDADLDDGGGITSDGRSLVTTDGTTVTVWDLADFRRVNSWPRPVGKRLNLFVAPFGRRAVVYNADQNRPVMIDLDTGLKATLPLWVGSPSSDNSFARASMAFCPDGRTYLQLTRISEHDTSALCIKDLITGTERFVPLGMEAGMVRCSADSRTAVVTLLDGTDGAGIVQVIDLTRAEKIGQFNIRVVRNFHSFGIHICGQVVAVNTYGIVNGQRQREIQLWDLSDKRRITVFPDRSATGWNCDGNLVTSRFGTTTDEKPDGLRLFDSRGNEISHWQPAPQGPEPFAWLMPIGRFLIDWETFKVPAWRNWLQDRIPKLPHAFDRSLIHIYDARSGDLRSTVTSIAPWQAIHLSPDGQTLAASVLGAIVVWDVPPRTPGGIVLGLMIAEVAFLIAWTAWRRRRARRIRCAAP